MTSYHDHEYSKLVQYIIDRGVRKSNRTGVDTIGVFSYQMRFDLSDRSIPLLTSKKVHTKSIIHELLWMLSGSSNIKYLKDNGVTIWDEWADADGELGPVYGVQWRKWPTFCYVPSHAEGKEWITGHWEMGSVDQIAQIVDKLKNNPLDRRLIVSAWNVAELPKMKLPPCHYAFQFYTRPLTQYERALTVSRKYNVLGAVKPHQFGAVDQRGNKDNEKLEQYLTDINAPKYELSLMVNQRSCDVGLGVPFNIVQYSFMLLMFAEVANMAPGEMIWNGGDTHIYVNHFDQLAEQIAREPYPSPTFEFTRRIKDIGDFKYEDFVVKDYQSHPAIKMEVAV